MSRIHVILLSALVLTALAEDYYKVLEVSKDATEADIKRAFRRLSVKYHPDKNPGDQDAAQRFIQVNKAYEVLSTPDKRQIYDLHGEEGLQKAENPQTDMWGNQRGQPRGPNARADMWVTLEDLYNGAMKEMSIQRNILCPQCRGTGSKDGKLKVCRHCNGQGVRLQTVTMGMGMQFQMQVTCEYCGGKGKMPEGNCPTCGGQRVVPNKKTLKVEIERGMHDGHEIVFEKESEQSPDFIPGDVVFKLRQHNHHLFQRIGDNLYMEMKVDLKEAVLGLKRQIKHLDDHYVEIKSDKIIQPFSVKVIKEEGMPVHNFPSQHGDLHVKYVVNLPKKLSDSEKEIVRRIFALSK